MEGSGSGDSIISVTAPTYTGRTYTSTFKIKVNDNLYQDIVVTRNCKPTIDLMVALNKAVEGELYDSENYQLSDSESKDLYSKDMSSDTKKYLIVKTKYIQDYKEIEYAGLIVNILTTSGALLKSGTSDSNGIATISDLNFKDNTRVVIEVKGQHYIVPLDYTDDAFVCFF